MALIKEFDMPTGAKANYWRILAWQPNVVVGEVWIYLGGYLSAELRQQGKTPALERSVTMPLSGASPETIGRPQMYEFVKAYVSPERAEANLGPEFEDSADG